MTGKVPNIFMEDTMLIFAKRFIDMFIAGASQRPLMMNWPI
ncbi:hypothetical protein [Altericroceibacterium spongiae]|nr:hypothetical protein [Altericroceibacterium spongiae]